MFDNSYSCSVSSSLEAKMKDSRRNNSHVAPGFLVASFNQSFDEKKSCPELALQADLQDGKNYGDGPSQE